MYTCTVLRTFMNICELLNGYMFMNNKYAHLYLKYGLICHHLINSFCQLFYNNIIFPNNGDR